MGQFMSDYQCHELFGGGWGVVRINKQQSLSVCSSHCINMVQVETVWMLPVCDEAPVLHGSGSKVRDGDEIHLGEGIGHSKVVRIEG